MLENALKVVEAHAGTVSTTNVMNMGISPANGEKNKTSVTAATVLATSPGIVSKLLTGHPATNVMNMGISPANAEKNKAGVTATTVLATSPVIVSKLLTDHPATTVIRLATLHVNVQNHQTVLVVDSVARAITATRRGTLHATVRRVFCQKLLSVWQDWPHKPSL